MKTIKALLFIIVLTTGILNLLISQTAPFNLDTYKDFLKDNKDMTPTELLEMYPAGYFLDNVNLSYEDALYFDKIVREYNITEHEKEFLRKNGFVVTERLRQGSFDYHFRLIYKKDLPVFISTDAILHAYHCSYDAILKDIELDYLIDKLGVLLKKMHSSMDKLVLKYSPYAKMKKMLQDVDVYLTIPLKLLKINVKPFYPSNEAVIKELLNLIDKEQMTSYKLFSDYCARDIDFSQFKPRGHYAQDEDFTDKELENYFRAMMWLGRTEIYLSLPESDLDKFGCTEEQLNDMIVRQAVDALLLVELLELSGANTDYEEFEKVISFFVGEQDNVTCPQLESLKIELNIRDAAALLDNSTLKQFQQTLSTKTFSNQQIVSQLLYSDPLSPEEVKAASAFMLLGQRFVIDSYITGNVVFDHILYQGSKPCRLYPSTLDILFAFGNDASTQLLIPELKKYHYSSNLAGLRYLVDQYDDSFWESSLYCMWLKAIKTLSPNSPAKRENLPLFMQTGAWGLEKMNTQLASWTELRHDNLLYAKQSYTSGDACFYPCGYVEPIPEFYRVLNRTARIAIEKFKNLSTLTADNDRLFEYLEHLQNVTDTLLSISEKELSNTCLNNAEIAFIERLFMEGGWSSGAVPPNGWYPELFYNVDDILKNDFLVADYHTTPTDCGGNMIGAVSHAGTGYVDMLITAVNMPDGQRIAFIGPVMSYHEYVTTNFLRLNDEEWKESYFQKSFRPEWVNGYLADKTGASKSTILKLAASKEEIEKMLGTSYNYTGQKEILNSFETSPVSMENSPNPLAGHTVISFTIPEILRNYTTRLSIYDLHGKVIKTLVNEELPPGNYITKWDRENSTGLLVPKGMYIIRITVGSIVESQKIIVLE